MASFALVLALVASLMGFAQQDAVMITVATALALIAAGPLARRSG